MILSPVIKCCFGMAFNYDILGGWCTLMLEGHIVRRHVTFLQENPTESNCQKQCTKFIQSSVTSNVLSSYQTRSSHNVSIVVIFYIRKYNWGGESKKGIHACMYMCGDKEALTKHFMPPNHTKCTVLCVCVK